MAIEPNTPGARLRDLRRAAGVSAAELARRVGCATSAVTNHENGINGIRAVTATKYAELLGTTPQFILYGDAESGTPALPRPEGAAVILHQLPNGQARLQINKVVPFALALEILAKIEGAGE